MNLIKTFLSLFIFSSLAISTMPALAEKSNSLSTEDRVYVCMSFAQQRKSIESFLLLAEIENRFAKAVNTDNRLAQSCIEVSKVKDESLVNKLLRSIEEGQNQFKVASPARLELSEASQSDAVNRSVVYYSTSDIAFAESAKDLGRQQFSLQVQALNPEPSTNTSTNIFDRPQRHRGKALTFGFTYFGSTEYVVRKIVDGSDLSLNGSISILLSKVAALMLGDFYLYDPAPSTTRTARYWEKNEVQNRTTISSGDSNFLTSTRREAVFFIRFEF